MHDRIHVLYVDDSQYTSQVYTESLLEHGFDVVTAKSPEDGLDQLTCTEVDCVLSDLEMPGTDGFEFLSTIRTHHPGLPFILFTGNESEQTIAEAFNRGVTDFVPKSFCAISAELLCRRIEQAVATG